MTYVYGSKFELERDPSVHMRFRVDFGRVPLFVARVVVSVVTKFEKPKSTSKSVEFICVCFGVAYFFIFGFPQ